jgi:hypothetical protein
MLSRVRLKTQFGSTLPFSTPNSAMTLPLDGFAHDRLITPSPHPLWQPLPARHHIRSESSGAADDEIHVIDMVRFDQPVNRGAKTGEGPAFFFNAR